MNRNPFTPPSAHVADKDAARKRPAQIRWALAILVIVFANFLVRSVLVDVTKFPGAVPLAYQLLIFTIYAGAILALLLRINWLRNSFVAFTTLQLLFSAVSFSRPHPIEAKLQLALALALQAIPAALMVWGPGKSWFDKRK